MLSDELVSHVHLFYLDHLQNLTVASCGLVCIPAKIGFDIGYFLGGYGSAGFVASFVFGAIGLLVSLPIGIPALGLTLLLALSLLLTFPIALIAASLVDAQQEDEASLTPSF